MRNKKSFFLLLYDPHCILRHALVLKTLICGKVITIIAVIVQRINDILLYLCSSIPSKIRIADMLVEETYRETEGTTALLIVKYFCRIVCSDFVGNSGIDSIISELASLTPGKVNEV